MNIINERILAYHDPDGFLGDRHVFLIKHGDEGRDRSFFEGSRSGDESGRDSVIRIMQEHGGVDLSHNMVSELLYVANHPKQPDVQWMAAELTIDQAEQVSVSEGSIGKILDISIWDVWSELYQIHPDTQKGIELGTLWNSTLFQLLRYL